MITHTEPAQRVELTGTASTSDKAHDDDATRGPLEGGEMLLQTRSWSNTFLLLVTRTCVRLDGQRYEVPWGQLRLPVEAGRHQLRVSFRYLGRDCGAATKDFEVRGGHLVELSYRAPWLVLLPGKLQLRSEDRQRPVRKLPSGLPGSAPPLAATPGWYRDPSDCHQRRWWDGERWTPAIVRPLSRATKAGIAILTAVTLIAALLVGRAIGSAAGSGSDDSAALAESAEWVMVTEIDGVRFDMPRQPRLTTEPVPGTDVYYLDFGDIELASAGFGVSPADTRTDAAILRASANGAAAEIDGTIVFSRKTTVDGEPGLDVEVTTPQDGGATVLARLALADDLLVMVSTVFLDQDDREVAALAHNRMSRSIRFEG